MRLQEKEKSATKTDSPDLHVSPEIVRLLDDIPFYVLLIDKHHRILMANKAVRDVLKLDPKDILGKYCPKVVHGTDERYPGCPLEEAVEKGHGVEREMFDTRSQRWLNSAVYPTGLRTEEGGLVYLHMTRDITDKKKAEEEILYNYQNQAILATLLRISLMKIPFQKQLSLLLDQMTSIPRLDLQRKGAILLVEDNDETLAMKAQIGFDESALASCARVPFGKCVCGRAASSGRIEFVDDAHKECSDRCQKKTEHCHFCIPIRSNSRTLGVVSFYANSECPRGQKDIELLSSAADILAGIIERNHAEESLRESEEKLRNVVDASPDAIVVTDLNGNIIDCNPATLNLLGYPAKEELINKSLLDHIAPRDQESARAVVERSLEQSSSRNLVYALSTKENSQLLGELSSSVVMDSSGRPTSLIMVIKDITARKLLESEIAQVQKLEAIGRLAAGIAHEINTPIQYVGDNTRFLQEAMADINDLLEKYQKLLAAAKADNVPSGLIEEVESAIEEADLEYLMEDVPNAIRQSLEGVDRVSRIVRAMKEFSHPGTEEKTNINVNKAIENTITVARNEWKYVADVETDLDPELPLVPCVPSDFNQVILNMITNAAQAIEDVPGSGSDERGTITISTKRNGKWAEIRISDTGTGIPPEIRDNIFDPFFTTKEVGKGTGQGLSIIHSTIVNKHGGAINFETEVGKGTTFIIRLPLPANPT